MLHQLEHKLRMATWWSVCVLYGLARVRCGGDWGPRLAAETFLFEGSPSASRGSMPPPAVYMRCSGDWGPRVHGGNSGGTGTGRPSRRNSADIGLRRVAMVLEFSKACTLGPLIRPQVPLQDGGSRCAALWVSERAGVVAVSPAPVRRHACMTRMHAAGW